ncbi:ABC transporter ATP-binding protein [Rugosimonospora acidiphila]|uniref:ABC transporter ATP-binding protein n=1 Tax=Rugosimonospora acidiphila TaxID=556531 RepID=A0ABP9SJ57_9ACTN
MSGQAAGRLSALRRGLTLAPQFRRRLGGTVLLGVIGTIGKVVVPVAVQQGIDGGLEAPGGPDLGRVVLIVAVTLAILVITTLSGYAMNVRLYIASESALADIRTRTFRHIHDLSMLHQQSERRGSMVSRVTTDIDQISQFLQYSGVNLLLSAGQLVVTTIVMIVYSWQLTIVVYLAFAPMILATRWFQRRLSALYGGVRVAVGAMLAAIAESVVGASVIRAYGIRDRTARRLDATIEANRRAEYRAQRMAVLGSQFGELSAAVATAAAVVVGVVLGIGGHGITVGMLTAFLFLVVLFIQPVQTMTEVITQAQNAIAGWRRVLEIQDIEPDVADPGGDGVPLPDGPLDVDFRDVSFAYPGGPDVLSRVELRIPARRRVAVVGETGSGKTTLAKLLTRLMDPTRGEVLVGGRPLTDVRFDSLRQRVVMVPQDGFLFDATVADNARFGRPELTDEQVGAAFTDLGLADWLAGLPDGLATQVGERGEALSVGERQLVALARAYLADPDLLVLDEATSAVDPATEVRLQRTLDAVTRGRTTVAIAHRLSTAEGADEVIVVDAGRIVQRGPHATLLREPGSVYAKLYASWLEQTRADGVAASGG